MTSEESRETTLRGLARSALDPSMERALLEVAGPEQLQEPIAPDLGIPFSLSLTNQGRQSWPGFDPDPEGLIRVRISWMSEDGSLGDGTSVPVDQDLEPGETIDLVMKLEHPGKAGVFFYCFELIQETGNSSRVLTRLPTLETLHILPADSASPAVPGESLDTSSKDGLPAWRAGCGKPPSAQS